DATATTGIYTLSLHDALPISPEPRHLFRNWNLPPRAVLGDRRQGETHVDEKPKLAVAPFRGTVNVMFSDAMRASTKDALLLREEIGRASCRERVESSGGGV